jgi:hypothetical protein
LLETRDNRPTDADNCIKSDSPERGLQSRQARRRRPKRADVSRCVTPTTEASLGLYLPGEGCAGYCGVRRFKVLIADVYLFADSSTWAQKSAYNEARI